MRFFLAIVIFAAAVAMASASDATGRIAKVLPFYLDLKNRDAISPSLFDRDAYQVQLRENPTNVSAIRFDVLWKASNVPHQGKTREDVRNAELKLRAELRGVGGNGLPRQTVLEMTVSPHFFSRWTSLTLHGDEFKNLGSLVAWRITLWNGNELLAEQKSFLW